MTISRRYSPGQVTEGICTDFRRKIVRSMPSLRFQQDSRLPLAKSEVLRSCV